MHENIVRRSKSIEVFEGLFLYGRNSKNKNSELVVSQRDSKLWAKQFLWKEIRPVNTQFNLISFDKLKVQNLILHSYTTRSKNVEKLKIVI